MGPPSSLPQRTPAFGARCPAFLAPGAVCSGGPSACGPGAGARAAAHLRGPDDWAGAHGPRCRKAWNRA
eukprot:9049074-Pyramimonas_sp.AAC.2